MRNTCVGKPGGPVQGWESSRSRREDRVVCGVLSRGKTRVDASVTPSEGDKEGHLSRSILDCHASKGRFSKVVGESLNQCHLSEASGVSQEQGCPGMPAALSQWLGTALGKCGQYKHSDGFLSSSGSTTVNDSLQLEVSVKWGHTGVGWAPNDRTDVLIERGALDTDMHTEKAPCEDEGREEWCFYKPKNVRGCQQTTRSQFRDTNRFSLTAVRRNQACRRFHLALQVFRTMTQKFLLVKPLSLWYSFFYSKQL